MCGIFSYSGPRDVREVLIEGLEALEYRGYDSAGIAYFDKNHIHRFRALGGAAELKKKVQAQRSKNPAKGFKNKSRSAEKSIYKNSIGIGHTRWATHGAPSEKNAHPHRAGPIYVVHNGVIENEEEIKKIINPALLKSETDTEVIPHLIDHFCSKEKLSFLKSLQKSVQWLKGSYAVAAIHEKNPDEIIAFKSGPPLILCKGKNEFFISSDPHAVGRKAQEMIFLEDEELLFLKKDKFQIYNFKGKKLSKKMKSCSSKIKAADKGRHPHFMLKEILEQPASLRRLIGGHIDKNKKKLAFKLSKGDKKEFDSLLKSAHEILILACGSSYHSALFAKYLLEDAARLRVNAEMASEFIYRKAFLPKNTLVLFISQSGETADILTALKQTKEQGLKSLSLCNIKNSSLERSADFCFSMQAGLEVAVASTKTFSASLTALVFLAFHTAKVRGFLDSKKEQSFIKALLAFPLDVEKVLQRDSFFLKIIKKLKNWKTFFYLGRGLYYPVALEGALKLKEIAYLHAEAYPSGEMKHGPLAMIDKKTAVIALLPHEGVLYKKSLTNLKEAKSRGAFLISLGGKTEDKELKRISGCHLPLPKSGFCLRPILSAISLQRVAYYISRSYGRNIDKPRNLAKSVTVE